MARAMAVVNFIVNGGLSQRVDFGVRCNSCWRGKIVALECAAFLLAEHGRIRAFYT
jgi:hypothetical protein